MATPQTIDQYAESLKALRPAGPSETLAEGMRPLDETTQGLIEEQAAKGLLGNDAPDRMSGVGDAGMGLMRAGGTDSMGMALPEDFDDVMAQRGKDAVAGTVQRIRAADEFTQPMRQGRMQAQASANFAKSENLRFNNWALKNTQALQKMQIEQMKRAQEKSFLSSVLGLGGAIVGGVGGFVVGGPAGAVAGAGIGMGVGGGIGQAAG